MAVDAKMMRDLIAEGLRNATDQMLYSKLRGMSQTEPFTADNNINPYAPAYGSYGSYGNKYVDQRSLYGTSYSTTSFTVPLDSVISVKDAEPANPRAELDQRCKDKGLDPNFARELDLD